MSFVLVTLSVLLFVSVSLNVVLFDYMNYYKTKYNNLKSRMEIIYGPRN